MHRCTTAVRSASKGVLHDDHCAFEAGHWGNTPLYAAVRCQGGQGGGVAVVAVGAILTASISIVLATVASAAGGQTFAMEAGRKADPSLTPGEQSRKGTVWVVNRDRGELAIFDAETGTVVALPLFVGAGAHDICISERARKAYITAETDNAVTVVDTLTLATKSIPVGPLPHHVEPSHDGRTIYVSLASHTSTVGAPVRGAPGRGNRHRRRFCQLHDYQQQPRGALARDSPLGRRREALCRPRSGQRGLCSGRRQRQHRVLQNIDPEGGRSHPDAVRQPALGVLAR